MNAVGIIFSNIYDSTLGQLTGERTVASLPFGGRYRQKMIVKYSDNAATRRFFGEVYEAGLAKCPKNVRLDADANPTVI